MQFTRDVEDLVLILRNKKEATAQQVHAQRKRRSTHSKHTNAHTELSKRNHLFLAPSMKEDRAVEKRKRKGGRKRQRE